MDTNSNSVKEGNLQIQDVGLVDDWRRSQRRASASIKSIHLTMGLELVDIHNEALVLRIMLSKVSQQW